MKQYNVLVLSAAIAAAAILAPSAYARDLVDKSASGAAFVPSVVLGGIDGTITAADVNGAPIVGTTVGGTNSVPTIPAACHAPENWTSTAGVETVYQFTPGTAASLTFVLTSTDTAAFDPFIYILGTLGASASCVIGSDDLPTANAPSITYAAFTAGQPYYVYADSFFGGDAGPFTLTVTGTLPVSLQEFSVD